jgi:hypothetical protein
MMPRSLHVSEGRPSRALSWSKLDVKEYASGAADWVVPKTKDEKSARTRGWRMGDVANYFITEGAVLSVEPCEKCNIADTPPSGGLL